MIFTIITINTAFYRVKGYRSVPLKNSYSEELELASLLVHIEIVNAKVGLMGPLRGKHIHTHNQDRKFTWNLLISSSVFSQVLKFH